MKLNNYVFEKIPLTGRISMLGKINMTDFSFTGNLSGENVIINKYYTDKIAGSIVYVKDMITISDLKINKSAELNMICNTKNQELSGNIAIENYDLSRLNVSELTGNMNCNAKIVGTLKKPEIYFYGNSDNITLKKMKLKLNGKGQFASDSLKISGDIKTDTKEKGLFNMNIIKITENPEINSTVSFNSMDMLSFNKILTNLINFSLPLEGKIDSMFEITGSLKAPITTISLNSAGLIYDAEILPKHWTGLSIITEFNNEMNQAKIIRFDIESDDQKISITKDSVIDFGNNSVKYKAGLSTKNFNIKPLNIFGNINLSGEINTNNDNIFITSLINIDNLWINQQNIKNTNLKVQFNNKNSKKEIEFMPLKDQDSVLSGKIDFSDSDKIIFSNINYRYTKGSNNADFKLNGNFTKTNSNLSAEGTNISLDFISSIIDLQLPLNGYTDFTVIYKGHIEKPYITGSLNVSAGEFYSIPFTNANIQFTYNNFILEIPNSRLVKIDNATGKEQLALSCKGSVPITIDEQKYPLNNKDISLSFDIEKGDLSILKSMSEEIKTASGKIDAKLQISGPSDRPSYGGYLIISEGEIQSSNYFDKMQKLNVGITFSDNKLDIKKCSAKVGDGKIEIEGYMLLGELFNIDEYNLKIITPDKKGIKVFIKELPIPTNPLFKSTGLETVIKNYSFGEPKIDLQIIGKKNDVKMLGYIELDNTHFSYPPPKNAPKGSIFTSSIRSLKWNMDLRAGENTWYDSDLMSVNIGGKLNLAGNYPDITVNGNIESRRGNISYIDKVFEIKEALFEVINNECYLQARTETTGLFSSGIESGSTAKEVGKVEMIIPRSPIGQIAPQFTSRDRPDMTSEKLVSATYGITENMTPSEQNMVLRKQLVRLFDASLASPLARKLLQKSGIADTMRVTTVPTSTTDTDTSPTDNPTMVDIFSGTKYTLEKYLTGDLLLGYALTLGEKQKKLDLKHEFELAYRWKGNIFVRGIYGFEPNQSSWFKDGEYQIRIEPQWRFGWSKEQKKETGEKEK